MKEIILIVDIDTILANVTEYDGKYVTDNNAETLLTYMEENIRDWFYENIGTVVEQQVENYIHEVMNPEKEIED